MALKEANQLAFHSNAPSFPTLLAQRGLKFGRAGELALFGAYRAHGTGPPSLRVEPDTDLDPKHRAVIERRKFNIFQDLGEKRLLALHLKSSGASDWAPTTFLSPEALTANTSDLNARSIFFLKHTLRERNEGVSVHLGVEACHKAWLSLPAQEQPHFVAQQEVSDVLLDDTGRKMTLRIYLLLLLFAERDSRSALALARRNFVCRLHPRSYDAADPDPARHVHSTLDVFKDVDGLSSTAWQHSDTVWPCVIEMFQAGFELIQELHSNGSECDPSGRLVSAHF